MQLGRPARITLLVTLAMLLGCNTVPNVASPPIPVPRGLNENDVELAILLAVAERRPPDDISPGQKIADNALTAVLGDSYDSLSNPRQYWYYEDREPGVIYVGFQRKRYYMRVAISFDARSVQTKVVDSRNLDQNGGQIHKSALLWTQEIEGRIRKTLGMIARRNLDSSS